MRVWKDCSCVWIETKMDNIWEKKHLVGIFTVYELKTRNCHYLWWGGSSLIILQHFKRLKILKVFMSRTFFDSFVGHVGKKCTYEEKLNCMYVGCLLRVDKFYTSNAKKKILEFSKIHFARHTVRSHFLTLTVIDENIRM